MPPTYLLDSLQSVRRKVKTLSIAYGVGIVVACVVGVVFATAFLDWCFDLPAVPRLVFVLASLVGIGWAAHRWIVVPALARLSLSDVAGRLENAFPQFGDRLRSTVNFTRDGDAIPGSAAMKDRVITETTRLAQSVNLSSAVVIRPVLYSLAGGLAALGMMGLIAALVGPEYVRPALVRLLNPFTDTAWPKRTHIEQSSLPQRVPVGAKVNVSMKLTKGDKPGARAIVYYQYDNGPEQMVNMNRDAKDGSFSASLDARGEGLKVWVRSGDDETKPVSIAVVPRLAIAKVTATITPPKYAKVQPFTVDLSGKPAMVTYGSDVKLSVAFNKPLDAAKPVTVESVRADQPLANLAWDRSTAAMPTASWNARESMRFRVRATDQDGFSNTALEEYEVLVSPDQLPRVVIERPTEKLGVTPEATVRLQIRAEDDFDISSMTLVVQRMKRADKASTQPAGNHWEIALANWERIDKVSEFQPFRLNYEWDLSKLDKTPLQPGDLLEYSVVVRDNFELDGRTHPPVSSRKMELAVISQKDLEGIAIDKLRQVSEEVAQVQRGQKNAQEATRQLQQDTKDKPEFSKADKEVTDKRVNDQSALGSQTRSISERVKRLGEMLQDNKSPNQELKDLTKDVEDALDRAADKPMKGATDKLNEASRQQADQKASPKEQQQAKDQRNQALADAQQNQQQAGDQLQQALDRMKNIGTLQKAIESVQKLLDKQREVSKETAKIGKENLGKKRDELSKDAKDALDKNAKAQSELSKETQKATDELQKAAEQLQRADQPSSEAMKEAAKQSQQQNVPQKQQQAADDAEQNQQSQAQANQKQAELGLQMMLDTLREAEKRKLEKLVKQLDDAMKAVANLIRQQAGHNVDNLMNQGGDAAAKQVTDDLLAKSKRVRGAMPPLPNAAQLPGLQEQTERNTSDVLKTIGDIPGGAEAAASLNRASTKMGYAIVSLRDKKLGEAFDPHQSEALSALEAALAKLEEQKKQAEDKQEAQRKEKLREVYVKIRDDQVKLNDQTAKLDKARTPDGALKRAERIEANKLPGDQGGLVDRIKKVGEDLAGISVVYQWANADIEKSMGEVKDELAKPELGVTTQAEQTRIVDQLNAMIENLKVTPPQDDKKFADKNGGNNGGGQGQGGQQKTKLPGEAELRLLKDLQLAVNKNTLKLDDEVAKNKDKGDAKAADADTRKLASLGGRQGELRNVLDELLKKSNGKGLGERPDPSAKLPEEATKEEIEADELEKQLLQDKPGEDKASKDINLIGDRMARSQSRLGDDHDPGKTTQRIQERIVLNMDELIQIAQQQQKMQMQKQKGQPKPEQGPQQPGQDQQQANNQGQNQQPKDAQNPGTQSNPNDVVRGSNENGSNLADLKETAENWGQVSPRLKDAVVEGATEKVPEKYRSLVQDYYRSLATKATERK